MENHAPSEPDARVRLTHDQAQELVLRTVAKHAESLLRTAYRHSLCADDAHDAYQRSMEIFLRRARTLDPASAHKWLHVVVKHESLQVRRTRTGSVPYESVDFDHHSARDAATPEERALSVDRATRAAEALRRLKPQELRAIWLKALGHSYAEISEQTGYSATKVNRCLTEGRKSFMERYEGIETGAECERWQPVLSAMVDGEATAAQITDARPHLRNCPACRATLRGLHDAQHPLRAVLPLGLVSVGAKLSGLLERLLPGMGGGDAGGVAAGGVAAGGAAAGGVAAGGAAAGGVAAGGAGVFGVGGAKLAGLLAAGAAATAGGGLVVAQEVHHGGDRAASSRAVRATPAAQAAVGAGAARTVLATLPAARTPAGGGISSSRRAEQRHRLSARRSAGRIEFAPRGVETTAPVRPAPTAVRATASRPATAPAAATTDSTRGEFAPQP